MLNDYLSTTLSDGTTEVLSILLVIALQAACKKQVDSKSSREALRLMQLGFLNSGRWDSCSSIHHFETVDTVDVGRVLLLK